MKYILLTLTLFFTDFFSKNHIEKHPGLKLPEKSRYSPGRFIRITRVHNEGFMMHTLDTKKHLVKGISGCGALFFLILGSKEFLSKNAVPYSGLAKTGTAFFLAGALGNTYDRFRRGFVVDFIRFRCFGKKFSRIVFNLADFFLFAGAVLYSLSLLLRRNR